MDDEVSPVEWINAVQQAYKEYNKAVRVHLKEITPLSQKVLEEARAKWFKAIGVPDPAVLETEDTKKQNAKTKDSPHSQDQEIDLPPLQRVDSKKTTENKNRQPQGQTEDVESSSFPSARTQAELAYEVYQILRKAYDPKHEKVVAAYERWLNALQGETTE